MASIGAFYCWCVGELNVGFSNLPKDNRMRRRELEFAGIELEFDENLT